MKLVLPSPSPRCFQTDTMQTAMKISIFRLAILLVLCYHVMSRSVSFPLPTRTLTPIPTLTPTPTPSPSTQCPFECRMSTPFINELPQYLSCVMMHVQCLSLLVIQPTPSPSAIQPTRSPSSSQCPLECRLGPTASTREILRYYTCLVMMQLECLNISSTPSPLPLSSHPLDCPLADTSLCDPQCPYVNFECPAGLIPSTRTFSQSEICEPLFSAEFNARCSFVFDDQGNIRAYKC